MMEDFVADSISWAHSFRSFAERARVPVDEVDQATPSALLVHFFSLRLSVYNWGKCRL